MFSCVDTHHIGAKGTIAAVILPETCLILPNDYLNFMLDNAITEALVRQAGLQCAGASTAVPRLELWSGVRPTGSEPSLFAPKFYLVLQGEKRMRIAGGIYDLGPGDCAVSILGLPFRYEVTTASPDAPYLGVGLTLDASEVAAILRDMPKSPRDDAAAFTVGTATAEIRNGMARLLRLAMTKPEDAPILAPLAERELLYRLLQSPLGGTMRRIAEGQGHVAAIRRAAERICAGALEPMQVSDIAAVAGMSLTSFHRHFKSVTGFTPLAYQRHVRLLDAQKRLTTGMPVTSVSYAVGYQSPSQFSREYKRMFGASPKRHLRSR